MRQVIIRYRVKPDQVQRNEELVRAVYAELQGVAPDGFSYATFKLSDGVTFEHLARARDGGNPLAELASFQAFQQGIAERCDEPPAVVEAQEIGSFAMFAG